MLQRRRKTALKVPKNGLEKPIRVLLRKEIERGGFTLRDLANAASLATAQAHKEALKLNVRLVTEVNGYLANPLLAGLK